MKQKKNLMHIIAESFQKHNISAWNSHTENSFMSK